MLRGRMPEEEYPRRNTQGYPEVGGVPNPPNDACPTKNPKTAAGEGKSSYGVTRLHHIYISDGAIRKLPGPNKHGKPIPAQSHNQVEGFTE